MKKDIFVCFDCETDEEKKKRKTREKENLEQNKKLIESIEKSCEGKEGKDKPLTLEQVKEIINKQEFNSFYRSEEIQKKYDLEKNERNSKLRDIIELEHYRTLTGRKR